MVFSRKCLEEGSKTGAACLCYMALGQQQHQQCSYFSHVRNTNNAVCLLFVSTFCVSQSMMNVFVGVRTAHRDPVIRLDFHLCQSRKLCKVGRPTGKAHITNDACSEALHSRYLGCTQHPICQMIHQRP